ncbi:hypothetical protein F5X99DRAFT_428902 [Biscogniauxia marginata]|nr:hypothetical protein F5X99DRAFT_428902 [Biscogniauxia marginata]
MAQTFMLPLLETVVDEDIEDCLLPKQHEERKAFSLSLFDCLYQVFTGIGFEDPFLPNNFPKRVLAVLKKDESRYSKETLCLSILAEVIDVITVATNDAFMNTTLQKLPLRIDERSNALIGLGLSTILSSERVMKSEVLADAVSEVASRWRPLSTTGPSPMEYLVAISLLADSQLKQIRLPEFPHMDLVILRGLLLYRKGAYEEAIAVLTNNMQAAIDFWGVTSFQVGIAAAESTNCYNMLDQANRAEKNAEYFLGVRDTQQLRTRPDWFYLALSLVDSLTSRGRYEEADRKLQGIIDQPSASNTLRMITCLRLSKVRRRMQQGGGKAFEVGSPLQIGATLLTEAPIEFQQDYLEEMVCNLILIPATEKEQLRRSEELFNTVKSLLAHETLMGSPNMVRYIQMQEEFSKRNYNDNDGEEEEEEEEEEREE